MHYSLASANLLFISALCSLSVGGGGARTLRALLLGDARPRPLLVFGLPRGLMFTEVFFGFGTLETRFLHLRGETDRPQTETQKGRDLEGEFREDVISEKITLMKAQDSEKHGM